MLTTSCKKSPTEPSPLPPAGDVVLDTIVGASTAQVTVRVGNSVVVQIPAGALPAASRVTSEIERRRR